MVRNSNNMQRHGMSHTPEYDAWAAMKERCYNPKTNGFAYYGGKGITVCKEWRNDFLAFFRYLGPRPSPSHSVDRIENDKGYEPGNVRWADVKTQNRNRTNNHFIEALGETLCLTELAERCNLTLDAIQGRLKNGWTLDEIVSTPYLGRGGGTRKLAPDSLKEIRRMYDEGKTKAAIARHFNVAFGVIAKFLDGKTYKGFHSDAQV